MPIRQTQQPIGNLRILIDQATLIAVTGLRSAEDHASQADIRLLPINRLLRQLPALTWAVAFLMPLSANHVTCILLHTCVGEHYLRPSRLHMRYQQGIHATVIAKSVAKNRSDIHARGTTLKQEPRSPTISKIIACKHLARPTVFPPFLIGDYCSAINSYYPYHL